MHPGRATKSIQTHETIKVFAESSNHAPPLGYGSGIPGVGTIPDIFRIS